jgi:hypothetical protein
MLKGNKLAMAMVCGAIVVAATAVFLRAIGIGGHPATAQAASSESSAAENLRLTLDPMQFQGDVRKAYKIAQDDPALLAQLHCYCGCDKADGHRNLLDCYRDQHGAHCEICVGEATDAEAMAKRGVPIDQIREALRARYAHED